MNPIQKEFVEVDSFFHHGNVDLSNFDNEVQIMKSNDSFLNTDKVDVGIVFIQGAGISVDKYTWIDNLKNALSEKFNTYISIPKAYLDTPISYFGTWAIDSGIKELKKNGFKGEKFILIGHSLGGIAVTDYAYENPNIVSHICLLGSYLERKYRTVQVDFKKIIIGGELDGLVRVTKLAEVFAKDNALIRNLLGVSHMQFASGSPTWFIKKRDFKPEITLEDAHKNIVSTLTDFLFERNLEIYQEESKLFYEPIIKAFELEGSIWFNRPDQKNCKEGFCGDGSEWAIKVQSFIANDNKYIESKLNLAVQNNYVILSSLPPFGKLWHPKLIKNGNKVQISSYCQSSFDKKGDEAYSYLSSHEIGCKFVSRQCSLIQGIGMEKSSVPIDVDKSNSLCKAANEMAMDVAKVLASNIALKRYYKQGQQLKFLEDIQVSSGLSFVYGLVSYTDKDEFLEVQSKTMITDIDAKPVPIFAPDGSNCYHYCKLMSPARALEWIYVDSLRKNNGL